MSFKNILNDRQVEILNKNEGVFLLLGDPGTGKTFVLIKKVVEIIKNKNDEDLNQIYFFTTTSKLGVKTKIEIEKMCGKHFENLFVGTIYDFSQDFLAKNNLLFGKRIISNEEAEKILSKIISDFKFECDRNYDCKTIFEFIRFLKSKQITVELYKDCKDIKDFPEYFFNIYEKYEQEKINKEIIDYVDVLLLMYDLLNKDKKICRHVQNLFKYIFVDDFQNITKIEYMILKKCIFEYQIMHVVWNYKECLYSFCGADYSIIDNLKKDFPNYVEIELKENYYCSKNVISCANSLFDDREVEKVKTQTNKKVISFVCSNMEDQEPYSISLLIKHLLNKKKYNISDFAIILRDCKKIGFFIKEMKKCNINCSTFDEESKNKIKIGDIYSAYKISKKCIFIPEMNERKFPLEKKNIEEEKRLFYVALTRAQNEIFLSYSLLFMSSFKMFELKKSQFIEKIDSVFINDDIQTISSLKLCDCNFSFYSKVTTFNYSFVKKKIIGIKK